MSLSEICSVTAGQAENFRKEMIFRRFFFDSRESGGPGLFFALKSEKGDGHQFLGQLAGKKGMAAVVRRDFQAAEPAIPLIRVDDPLRAAQQLAGHVRSRLGRTCFVGITGSAGKTTTKEFAFQILARRYATFRSPENWNNWIGLPFSILRLTGAEEVAVFEIAMSNPGIGEIDLLANILQPNVAVILNALPVHLEFLGTVENVARAKSEMLNYMNFDSCALVNGDTEELRRSVSRKSGQVLFFGCKHDGNSAVLKKVERTGECSLIVIDFFGSEEAFSAPLINRTHIENIFVAILIARQCGMRSTEIREALGQVRPLSGRGVIRHEQGYDIIDETYNSNPEALKKTLLWMDEEFPHNKVAVLGDMLELGSAEDDWHRQCGRFFAILGFERLLTVGRLGGLLAEGARQGGFPIERIAEFENAEQAGKALLRLAKQGQVILFKASRGIRLEQALSEFLHGQ